MPQPNEGPTACLQEIADEAQGENVLVVTHGDAVNASVSRIWPWAIVHPVTHTGYTVASRERRSGMIECNSTAIKVPAALTLQ